MKNQETTKTSWLHVRGWSPKNSGWRTACRNESHSPTRNGYGSEYETMIAPWMEMNIQDEWPLPSKSSDGTSPCTALYCAETLDAEKQHGQNETCPFPSCLCHISTLSRSSVVDTTNPSFSTTLTSSTIQEQPRFTW